MTLNLRYLAESDKVVVIGSSLLLELRDRRDALEAGATADGAWAEVERAYQKRIRDSRIPARSVLLIRSRDSPRAREIPAGSRHRG